MRRVERYAAALVLVMALLVGCTGGGSKVVATVNEDKITERQLRTFAGLHGFLEQVQLDVNDEAVRRQLLGTMATEQLMLQEASRRRLTPDAELVAFYRDLFRESFGGSQGETGAAAERELAAELRQYGVTVSDLDSHLERIAMMIALHDDVLAEVEVTDDEVRQFYDDHPELFTTPLQRRASHILIRTGELDNGETRTSEEAEALIREIEAELRQDLSRFAELARTYSEDPGSAANGGDLDFFGRGRMVPEFEEAAFTTPVGELSEPVQTSYGWHLVLVTDERAAEPVSFDEVRDGLREELRQQKAGEVFAELLEDLRANATYTPADLFQ